MKMKPKNIVVKPNSPPQKEAYASNCYELLYGGSCGCGKTFYIVTEPLRHINNPKFRGIIFRRTYPELEGSIIPLTHHYYLNSGAVWNETKKQYTFPSGAKIRLGFVPHNKDWQNYAGSEWTYIGFDELTSFTWEQYTMLKSFNRSIAGIVPYIRAASNPGGISHNEVKKYFYDVCKPIEVEPQYSKLAKTWWYPTKSGKIYKDPETLLTRCFIPAKVYHNVDLLKNNPNYVAQLMSLPNIARKRLLDGDWEIFSLKERESFKWAKRKKLT